MIKDTDSKKIIVPVSGGKDSTVCLLLALKEHGWDDVIAVHNDTGWDHPVTYEYLNYLEQTLGVSIEYTSSPKGGSILDYIRERKQWPWGMGRFCTREFKQNALYRLLKAKGYYKAGTAECWLGVRTEESSNRKIKYKTVVSEDLYEYNEIYSSAPKSLSKHVKLRFPIIDWTEQEVFSYLDQRIDHNPLYDEGTNNRVGCYPCLLASKKIQAKMFATEVGQERLKILQNLAKEIGVPYPMYDDDQGSCELCHR